MSNRRTRPDHTGDSTAACDRPLGSSGTYVRVRQDMCVCVCVCMCVCVCVCVCVPAGMRARGNACHEQVDHAVTNNAHLMVA